MAELPDLPRAKLQIVESTNAFRRSEGLDPVVRNAALEHAARLFAQYLAKSGRFAHEADGRQPADRTRAAGYWHCMIAENLALNLDSRGFTAQRLATEVVEGWKASPGHRKNMVLPHVTEIGVGIAQALDKDPKFISVQLFGRPKHLAYSFRIANKSTLSVSYRFAGKDYALAPREIVTHTACRPKKIAFVNAGSWIGGTRIGEEVEAVDGLLLTVQSAEGGKMRVDKGR